VGSEKTFRFMLATPQPKFLKIKLLARTVLLTTAQSCKYTGEATF